MQLIIMRHGEAGSHSIDTQRALTMRGVEQAQQVAGELRNSGIRPSAIWSSPYVRARQTANVVTETLGVPTFTQNTLTPDSDPRAVLGSLQAEADFDTLMLVSHMPFVEMLTGLLLDGRTAGYPYSTGQARILELTYPAVSCGIFLKQFPATS